jgi:hypothetical protein
MWWDLLCLAYSAAHDQVFQLSAGDVQGKFSIKAPYLTEQWPTKASSGLTLTLSPSRYTGGHLWGSFKFGIVTGIIRGGKPPETAGETVAFKWRGYEQGEGEMEYHEMNTGTLTFRDDGKICGTMKGGYLGEFKFMGVRDSLFKHVKKWKAEWRGINDISYKAAADARWGKWIEGGDYKEQPAGSDTTSVADSSDDCEEAFDEGLVWCL